MSIFYIPIKARRVYRVNKAYEAMTKTTIAAAMSADDLLYILTECRGAHFVHYVRVFPSGVMSSIDSADADYIRERNEREVIR